jgi:polar amino acid transport system substrate-binding protein
MQLLTTPSYEIGEHPPTSNFELERRILHDGGQAKMRRFQKLMSAGMIIVLGIALGAMAGQFFARGLNATAAPAQEDLDRIVKAGTIRIGNDLTVKGKAFMDPATQKPSGFEVDIGDEMGKRMGVKVEWVQIPFDGLIAALNSGRIDLIHTGMFRLEKRALAVDFSEPLFRTGELLLVRADEARIKTLTDANNPAIKVGTELATVAEVLAHEQMGKSQILTYHDTQATSLALKTKQIDAWLDDDYWLVQYAKDHPEFKVVGAGHSIGVNATGIAVRRGSDLLPWVNLFLWHIKAEGWLKSDLQKWGFPASLDAPWDPHLFASM